MKELVRHRIGDTVYLNSGSPALIVTDVSGEILTAEWKSCNGPNHVTAPMECFSIGISRSL